MGFDILGLGFRYGFQYGSRIGRVRGGGVPSGMGGPGGAGVFRKRVTEGQGTADSPRIPGTDERVPGGSVYPPCWELELRLTR